MPLPSRANPFHQFLLIRVSAVVLLLFISLPGIGQSSGNIENVTLDSVNRRVYYEQRLYRNPLRGMLELLQTGAATKTTNVVPLYQGIPVARYQLWPAVQATALTRHERDSLRRVIPFSRGRYKLDFRLQPDFIARFGFKQDPLETKTSLLLQTQLYLRRGLVLNAGIAFPLVNNLNNETVAIRPAPIYLNQFLALGQRNFLSISAGSFYNNRYGVNVQYRRADLTRPWSFGIESSLTGFYYFPRTGIYYDPMNQFMLFADVAYRLPVYALTLKLSGGQYLEQARGVRLELIRQFASVEVGFFATKIAGSSTAGFNFAIPIWPGRIIQNRQFRLRTTEEFRWEYNYNGTPNVGAPYRVGTRLDALLRQYHQTYLRDQLRP